jgi:hypothetical protein
MTARLLVVLAVSAVSFSRAAAQEEDPVFLAQKRFEAARQLYDAGDFSGALSAFQSSLALQPSPNTSLYIARSLKHLGRLGEAVARYEEVVRAVAAHAERERYAPAAAAARTESRALEPRVVRLTLVLPDAPPGVTVRLADGRRLALPVERLPLDAGPAELIIEAPSRPAVRKKLSLVAGRHMRLEVRLTPASRPVAASQPVEPPTPGPAPGEERLQRALWLTGWTTVAAGAASLVTSVIFWRLAQSRFDTLESECGALPCPPGHAGTLDEGRRYQLATNVALGVGVGLAATGAALLTYSVVLKRRARVALRSDGSTLLATWRF